MKIQREAHLKRVLFQKVGSKVPLEYLALFQRKSKIVIQRDQPPLILRAKFTVPGKNFLLILAVLIQGTAI